jgi:hypothetical protein
MKVSQRRNKVTQSIEQLWESIANLSSHVDDDNYKCDEYPKTVRERQLLSIKIIISEIEKTIEYQETFGETND